MDEKTTDVTDDTPLRFEMALKLASLAGGITIVGLRKEITRGRLEVELIAGKYFTTLTAISRMHETCRGAPRLARRSEDGGRNASVYWHSQRVVSGDESELSLGSAESARQALFRESRGRSD
ncbi:hypothetical protein LPB73_17435 [Tardiphaga sp. 37S4]|uniref:hypothetical protein n=1 Tax=Tardiphaga sp. 37S4 TaxID=1404741 RepID=UPI001E38D4BC|nr:hypothetical protein [Tardiphaga sp. 37S4]UFS73715.1 hypothetical protein LPB73_17435 [Tardiphaga sp. 37S4]